MTVRRNKSLLLIVLAAALAGGVLLSPQEHPEPRQLLKEGDIIKFLSDFPVILEHIEYLSGDASLLSGLDLRSVDYVSIQEEPILVDLFNSYHWDELFFRKFRAIVHSFTIVEREVAREEAARELQKAILEIEDEPSLSPAQKQAMRSQYDSMIGMLDSMIEPYRREVHQADIALVRRYEAQLRGVFDNF